MIGNEIRKQLASFVLHEIPLESFEDWFVGTSWNAKSFDEDTRDLIYAIESRLAEFSGGHIKEQALRARLAEMIERYSVSVSLGAPSSAVSVHTGASQSVNLAPVVQMHFVDIQPSVACV